MPSTSIRLRPGVNTVETPALNEAGIVASNMIRFRDGLVEKRGGWTSYLAGAAASAIRTLWAWRDLANTNRLAIGAVSGGVSGLFAVTNGVAADICPRAFTSNVPNAFSTTSGSATVTVYDPNFNPYQGDVLSILTDVTIGGVVLPAGNIFPVSSVIDGSHYTITAGGAASSTVSNAGTVPSYTTSGGSATVMVSQTAHGRNVGDLHVIFDAVQIGGLTLSGFNKITSIIDANTYAIQASSAATSSATATENGGAAHLFYRSNAMYGQVKKGNPIVTPGWTLANYGDTLIAAANSVGLFAWSPNGTYQQASLIPNAPQPVTGMIVADAQQMIVTYGAYAGAGFDPNMVSWCDAGDYNTWKASGTNQAGTYRIPTGSGIVGMANGTQQIVIWTDVDMWSMSYIGYPFVWSFNKVAAGCGLLAGAAWAKLGTALYWMSQNAFWVYDGGTVRMLDCPVFDNVFPFLKRSALANIRGTTNSQFGEIVWFFPSTASASGENDSYVCFNPAQGTWDIGSMARSAWIDQSVLGAPMGADAQGNVYQHETSPDAAGTAIQASFTTGWFLVDEGETFSFVDWIRPDIKFPTGAGTVQVSVLTAPYTTDAPTVAGPYSVTAATEYINTRCRGRYVALRFASSDLGSFWRIGRTQMRFAPSGRR